MTKRRVLTVAFLAGLLVLVAGAWVESVVIAALQATGHELEWVSDLIAAAAVTGLTYLWLNLRETRTRVLDLERASIALGEQLRLAAEIQRTLLPDVPASTPGYLWAARMIPAHEIGGDFYDFVARDDGAVVVILGDVSGKGIPAALLQSSLKTLFRVHAAATAAPDAIAKGMSEGLREQTGGLPYASAILARLDPAPPRLTFVNAGHPAGIVLRGTQVHRLMDGGPPLGLLPNVAYASGCMDLQRGDLGVFVTDGVTEALPEGATLVGALEGLDTVASARPSEVCEYLLRVAGQSPGPAGAGRWADDRTALTFRVA